jgi:hypothetical protein
VCVTGVPCPGELSGLQNPRCGGCPAFQPAIDWMPGRGFCTLVRAVFHVFSIICRVRSCFSHIPGLTGYCSVLYPKDTAAGLDLAVA